MTPSLQLAATHWLTLHTLLMQSIASWHIKPSAHLLGQSPPQSTSLSVPFSTWSSQLAAVQVPPLHRLLAHASLVAQVWPAAHKHPPPQSTWSSAPFITPSLQLGAAQVKSLQTPLAQSPPTAQASPS